MPLDIGIASRLGNRAVNQDRCHVVRRDNELMLVLADGMGGHARGELAAQAAVDTLQRLFENPDVPLGDPVDFLRRAIAEAHRAVVASGLEQHPPVYPRTTLVACIIQNEQAWWAHVGDSRLYWIRQGEVLTRTRDHSYVEELYRTGAITRGEMTTHPLRNYVTHCLGGSDPAPAPTLEGPRSLRCGDVLVLCSDGFWSALEDQAAWYDSPAPLDETVNHMAGEAERRAYPHSDNISVVAARIHPDAQMDTGETAARQSDEGADEPDKGTPTLEDAIERIEQALRQYTDELPD